VSVLRARGRLRAAGAADVLVRALGHPDEHVRANAALALGALGDTKARARLVERLGDGAARVRAAAVRALAQLGARDAAARLAKEDPDPAVRALAAALAAGPAAPGALAPARSAASWFAFYLVDRDDGSIKPRARYWLTTPQGLIKAGWTDADGNAREEHVPDGTCVVDEQVDEAP